MAFDPLTMFRGSRARANDPLDDNGAPLGGTRRERMQRLQIGLFGLGFMVLSVGLANIIQTSARQNQAAAVEETPVSPTLDVPPPRDPLADAGVAPDLVEPETGAESAATPAVQEGADLAPPARD